VPELDVADGEGAGRTDTILVSVPPPDGLVLAAALRVRGFVVTEAPIDVLGARALAEGPRVIVADVDGPGALDAIERARDSAAAELVCVGDPVRAAEIGARRAEGRAFPRPLDIEALVLAVLALAEPFVPMGAARRPRYELERADGARETSPPPHRPDSDVPPSGYPSASDPLDVAVILPSLDEQDGGGGVPLIELSPELLQILDAAEQRVRGLGEHPSSSIPSPDEEDLLLPADLLASLDEPLDPYDEGSASGASTGGTGYPRLRTGGETPSTGASPDGSLDGAVEGGTGADSTVGGYSSAHLRSPLSSPSLSPPPSDPEASSVGLERGARTAAGGMGAPTAPEMQETPEIEEELTREGEGTFAGVPPFSIPARIGVVPIPVESMPDRPVRESPPRTFSPPREPPPRPPTLPAPPPRAFPPVAEERLEPSRAPVWSRESVEPPSPHPRSPPAAPLPAVLGEGDAIRALSAAIAGRVSGSIALGPDAAVRRIVLHEGDIVTAASSAPDETLVAFLAARGDLERDVAARLASKLPAHGRHAGAALIAHGHLGQDDLWPVLRAHAEWIIGRALLCDDGTCELEAEPPGRLKAEPNVFGGATGAEVLLEEIRRVVPPELARRRLGGPTARLAEGPRRQLLGECALREEDEQKVRAAAGRSVGELLAQAEPELADVLYGLVSLGVLEALAPTAPAEHAPPGFDPLDEEALRQRVRARVALVEDADYFALLGIPRSATSYEIRRAYLELRRAFEPGRVLTAATADLAADVRLVAEVLDEAYDILREPQRRERYRRAIEAGPP